jgi:hypothetical protein
MKNKKNRKQKIISLKHLPSFNEYPKEIQSSLKFLMNFILIFILFIFLFLGFFIAYAFSYSDDIYDNNTAKNSSYYSSTILYKQIEQQGKLNTHVNNGIEQENKTTNYYCVNGKNKWS